ncbi:MAG: hypothetical protein LBR42_01055 [Candidatus Methanoplasma sp.]|nr:hypothetical protein [Candidatus Methanoplasma sp.]
MSFKCSADTDTEIFLKKKALNHESNDISRTYLILDGDAGNFAVKGYFTLAVKCLMIDDRADKAHEIYDQMNINKGVAQAYLLGQLSKADGTEKGLGKKMIDIALETFIEGNKMFGCRTVRLDCKNEPKLLKYYESCGFTPIGMSRDGTMHQMVAII